MIEILDNINRSQDYLISLGFKVVIDEYENFRQFIVEDNCEEYCKFFQYLVRNNYHSGHYNFVLKSFGYENYAISIIYPQLPDHNNPRPRIIISNGQIMLRICDYYYFSLTIWTPFHHGKDFKKNFGDRFKKFFKNLNNDDNKLILNDLKCINDLFDEIDCEIINELDPMLYKIFMTIFNKPKIKSTNSIHIDD